jgi:hypothetical protein
LPAFLEDEIDLGGREGRAETTLHDFLPEDFRLGVLRAAFESQREGGFKDVGFDVDAMSFRASRVHAAHGGVGEQQGAC